MEWWPNRTRYFYNPGGYTVNSDCNLGPEFKKIYKNGMRSSGDYAWFDFTRAILEWYMEPTTEEGHQKLLNEILEGDNLQGYLDLGTEIKAYWNFNILLAVLTLLGFLAFLGGIGYKLFGKKPQKDVQNACDRVKMIPLFLVHIPLFILVVVLMALFSISLWNGKTSVDDDPTNDGLRMIEGEYTKLVNEGKCYYEVSIEGMADYLKKEITNFCNNATEHLQNFDRYRYDYTNLDGKIQIQLSNIKVDQTSVSKLQTAASKIVKQLNELQNLGAIDVKMKQEFDQLMKSMTTAAQDLLSIYTTLEEGTGQIREGYAAQTKRINEAVLAASEPLFRQLDEFKSCVNITMNSVHSAYRETSDWIKVVAKRNLKTISGIKQQGSLISYFVFTQAVITISSILALATLTLGFFALPVRIIYPKALGFCSSGTRKTRSFISFVFFAQCIFVGIVAFISGVALYYSAHLNGACVPMYMRDTDKNQIDKFYQTIGIGAKFIDYNGTVHKRSFVDVLYDYTVTRPGGYLLPENDNSKVISIDEWWKEVTSAVRTNDYANIKFAYQRKPSTKLTEMKSKFDDITPLLLTETSAANLYILVREQITNFQTNLERLHLMSFEDNTSYNPSFVKDDFKKKVESTFSNGLYNFNAYFNRIYSDNIRSAYMLTGETICRDLRSRSAGIWFSGTILSLVLLVSAIVMFKTADNLEGDFENKEVPVSVSPIYSPLIEGDKNPNEQEI